MKWVAAILLIALAAHAELTAQLVIVCETGVTFPAPIVGTMATGQNCNATSTFGGHLTKRTAYTISVYDNSESPQ